MSQPDGPMVVGAGPVGLGTALFLARQGRSPRVVEMRDERRVKATLSGLDHALPEVVADRAGR